MGKIAHRISKALPLREWTGPLTEDLVLRPGDFGLGKIPGRFKADAIVRTVCGFCSTGCGLKVQSREGMPALLTPDPTYPVNGGMACPKGWEALEPLSAADRALYPSLRKKGRLVRVEWEEAMREFVQRFKSIQAEHGADSIAVLSSGQICTEEMAYLGALAKFGMGLRHLDSNTRQCMATSAVAYKEAFGFDAPPYSYEDFERSDTLVFIGANPCIAHPIMWQRVLRNPHRPRIVVIDPRRTETAMNAHLHLPIRPKSDLVFLYGIARGLIEAGYVRRDFIAAHTEGFEAFAEHVSGYAPEMVEGISGIPRAELDTLVEWIGRGRRVSFWWTMGVNQGHESTRTAQAIINLALMTGNIGRPGTGANSLTGQCNAMGSRLFANATSLFTYDFGSKEDRKHASSLLGVPEDRIPQSSGKAYDQIIDGIEAGEIKGLWIVGTNTFHSWIDRRRIEKLRSRLKFLVVQDMYTTTESSRVADLVLPAAGWGEKEGTFINSERRIGVVRKVARAPGDALADFAIFRLVAEAWGCGGLFREWTTPEAVFGLLRRLSEGRPCDFSGVTDYRMIERAGGIQWPYTKEDAEAGPPETHRRLFEDSRFFTASGKAQFVFAVPREAGEKPDSAYPYIMLTGRGSSAQWHTGTRTGKSKVLAKLMPGEPYVEMHPDDAAGLGVEPGVKVEVASRRGRLMARAYLTPTVQRGHVFVPMHDVQVNRLTYPDFDAHSRQPSFKYCAVQVRVCERQDQA